MGARPQPPADVTFPWDEADDVLAALAELDEAVAVLRRVLYAVVDDLPRAMCGRTASTVQRELGEVVADLGVAGRALDAAIGEVHDDRALGRAAQRRHDEATWRYEQDLLRWRADQFARRGAEPAHA